MERIRCGRLARLRMWLIAARFSCGLLGAGALRGTTCLRSAFTPSSGLSPLVRVEIRTVRREVVHLVLSELAPNPTA